MKKDSISLIMCTCNRLDILIRFSNSLFSQTVLPNEYIIIDSSDKPINTESKFVESIEKKCEKKNIALQYYHTAKGLTLQRNIGISKASCDLLFFFDDDIVLEPNYIQILYNDMVNHKQYAGGMGKISSFNQFTFKRKILNSIKALFLLQHSYGDGKFYPSGWCATPHGNNKFLTVEVLSGGLTVYRKYVFDEFKFDEYFSKSGPLEDVDFSRRVSFKYKLFYNPEAVCHHLHIGGSRFTGMQLFENISKNYVYFFFKNYFSRNKLYIFPFIYSFIIYVFVPFKYTQVVGKFKGLIEYLNERNHF